MSNETKDDGGPAFPHNHDLKQLLEGGGMVTLAKQVGGMSLRDYFAANAMQGLVARIGPHSADLVSHDAYMIADAMLAERSKP